MLDFTVESNEVAGFCRFSDWLIWIVYQEAGQRTDAHLTDPSTDRPTNGIRSKNCATDRFGPLPLKSFQWCHRTESKIRPDDTIYLFKKKILTFYWNLSPLACLAAALGPHCVGHRWNTIILWHWYWFCLVQHVILKFVSLLWFIINNRWKVGLLEGRPEERRSDYLPPYYQYATGGPRKFRKLNINILW